MGEQLELTAKHKCDRCKESKERYFSYFTSRIWVCEDCSGKKGGIEINPKILQIVKEAEEYSCETFQELIELKRKQYNEDSNED